MIYSRYWKIISIVLITCMLAFSNTIITVATEDFGYYTETVWAYGGEYAVPFTELELENWGWSNGFYTEGTYTLDLYAGAYDNILENGIIVGEATIVYSNGNVEVNCKMFDDFFILEEVHLWIGQTELPPNSSGQFWYEFWHVLDESYPFTGGICVALNAVVSIDPIATLYGAEANPTGNPVGGGDGYTEIISRNDPRVKYIVDTQNELRSALQNAQSGEIVYVEGYANIDMGNIADTQIRAGVTLASNRGDNGALGGRIYLTRKGIRLFYISGENARITGLRIEGPHKTTSSVSSTNVAMYCPYQNLEVDNCEIFGWSNAAIGIAGTGGSDMQTGGYIHHNYIHHNQTAGSGYGIVISGGGVALIEANYFDYCRHAISGTGVEGDGYEARYNICGPNWISTSPHNFDMHGYTTGSGTIAGDTIKIYHNTFMGMTSQMPTCIAIRGIPRDGAYISNNWFYFTDSAPVWQRFTFGNIYMTNNLIGLDQDLSVKGPILIYN